MKYIATGFAGGGITCNARRGIRETAVMHELRNPLAIGTYNPEGSRTAGKAGGCDFGCRQCHR